MADFKIRFCKDTPGPSVMTRGGFNTTLDVSGNPSVTRQLLATSPLLTLQTFTVSGEGQRTVGAADHGCSVRILFDRARVEGMFAGQPFAYELLPTMAGNFNGDKVLEMVWGLAMTGRHYLLGSKGEYRLAKADADAHAEGNAVLIDAPVRVPEARVNVGEEWTTEWTGAGRQKETGAVFRYSQVALLQEITESPSVCAHIAFKTIGTLHFPDQPSPQLEETVLETKGTVVLDLESGLPVMAESFGMMTTELKRAGVKLVRGTSARYELQ